MKTLHYTYFTLFFRLGYNTVYKRVICSVVKIWAVKAIVRYTNEFLSALWVEFCVRCEQTVVDHLWLSCKSVQVRPDFSCGRKWSSICACTVNTVIFIKQTTSWQVLFATSRLCHWQSCVGADSNPSYIVTSYITHAPLQWKQCFCKKKKVTKRFSALPSVDVPRCARHLFWR